MPNPTPEMSVERIHGKFREHRRPELHALEFWYADDLTNVGISVEVLERVTPVRDRGNEVCYLKSDVLAAWRDMYQGAGDE